MLQRLCGDFLDRGLALQHGFQHGLAHLAQRAVQLGRLGALFVRQVRIARRQRQAVLGAHRLGGDDVDRQRELVGHAAHDHQLLVVLLAEHRHARLHAREQLHHHRAHALEEAGAEFAFEDVAQVVRRLDAVFLRLGVHVALGGREQHVDAFLLQLLDVCLQRARVFVEVFVGAELQPVDEDRRDHRVAVLARQAHQAQVALMQVAHGRHEGDAVLAAQLVAQFLDRGDDFHAFLLESGRPGGSGQGDQVGE